MKTYFACSDIHSFYDDFIASLLKAGFQLDNPDHILIVCGDIFDRGEKPLEVYRFLRELPKDRRYLIRGNHELLLKHLIRRGNPLDYDYSNGTYMTLLKMSPDYYESVMGWLDQNPKPHSMIGKMEWEIAYSRFEQAHHINIYDSQLAKDFLSWLKSDEWINYLELGNYVFVHSFVPKRDIYDSYWREKSSDEWEEAMWECPWKMYREGFWKLEEKQGKILVCGHWCTADFYNNLLYRHEKDKQLDVHEINPIFKSPLCPGLIGLDACTVLTHTVNVLVLTEKELGFE